MQDIYNAPSTPQFNSVTVVNSAQHDTRLIRPDRFKSHSIAWNLFELSTARFIVLVITTASFELFWSDPEAVGSFESLLSFLGHRKRIKALRNGGNLEAENGIGLRANNCQPLLLMHCESQ